MTHDTPAYGLWFLVAINSIVFILFAFSFTHPKTGNSVYGKHRL
jgi:methanethiol S-methyltransferase